MMQRRKFLKMPERVPLPSVNKNPAQRIPPGGIGDVAKAGYFFDIPGHAFTQGRKDMRAKLFAYSNVLAAIGKTLCPPLGFTDIPSPSSKVVPLFDDTIVDAVNCVFRR